MIRMIVIRTIANNWDSSTGALAECARRCNSVPTPCPVLRARHSKRRKQMRTKRYFSRESSHGSSSSFGFANDTIVLVFSTREARDRYVERSRNLSCRAIRASEATKEAANQRGYDDGHPAPFSNECWIIREPFDPERVPAGCIGSLEIGTTWDVGYGSDLERFYR